MKIKVLLLFSALFLIAGCSVSVDDDTQDDGNTDITKLNYPNRQASGKINGREFIANMGVATQKVVQVDGKKEIRFEMIVTDQPSINCDNLSFKRDVTLVLGEENEIFKESVTKDLTGSRWAYFYDYNGGDFKSTSLKKRDGMKWRMIEDSKGVLTGFVLIPAEDNEDDDYISGRFPVVDCM